MRTRSHSPRPRDTHFNVLSSRSNFNENYLLHLDLVACHDDSSHRKLSLPDSFLFFISLLEQRARGMRTHRGGILKTIFQQLYFIVFETSTVLARQDDSLQRKPFLENYLNSASHLVFSGSNTKDFLSILLFFFCGMLRRNRTLTTKSQIGHAPSE